MIGIFARAGTPAPTLQRIATDAIAVAREPEVVGKLAVIGVEVACAAPKEFGRALKNEAARVAVAVMAAGLKPQ